MYGLKRSTASTRLLWGRAREASDYWILTTDSFPHDCSHRSQDARAAEVESQAPPVSRGVVGGRDPADPGPGGRVQGGVNAVGEKGTGAAGAGGGQRVLRGFDADAHQLRA